MKKVVIFWDRVESFIVEYIKCKRGVNLEVVIVLWVIECEKCKFVLCGFGGKLWFRIGRIREVFWEITIRRKDSRRYLRWSMKGV